MKVLSLFDGMSCGQIALERVGIKVEKYFASEIDKYAISVTQKNYPSTIQIGDVTKVKASSLPKIDLLIGGSPCQGFSFAGKGLNFQDSRSKLFFEYVRLLEECQPQYFLLENVKMKVEYQNIISEHLGCHPVEINSNLVSGQNRKRLYWTNIPLPDMIPDKQITLASVLEYGIPCEIENQVDVVNVGSNKSQTLLARDYKGFGNQRMSAVYLNENEIVRAKQSHKGKVWHTANRMGEVNFPTKIDGKAKTLVATIIKGNRALNHIEDKNGIRMLTPIEYERLQNVPDNYTEGVSNMQRYKMLGNGWTVDIIAHIFKQIKSTNTPNP